MGFLFKMFLVAELIHTNGPLLCVCVCVMVYILSCVRCIGVMGGQETCHKAIC